MVSLETNNNKLIVLRGEVADTKYLRDAEGRMKPHGLPRKEPKYGEL
jgi:hypothetical protein